MLKASFDMFAMGCSGTGTSCADGGVCAAATSPLCVYQTGSIQVCPMSFPTQTIVYGMIQSNFACTDCTGCNVSGVATCVPTVSFYTNSGCSGASFASVNLDGTSCQQTLDAMSAKITSPGVPAGASCTATGEATLTGTVTTSEPVTVCCAAM
jgi:hypothetical protein